MQRCHACGQVKKGHSCDGFAVSDEFELLCSLWQLATPAKANVEVNGGGEDGSGEEVGRGEEDGGDEARADDMVSAFEAEEIMCAIVAEAGDGGEEAVQAAKCEK